MLYKLKKTKLRNLFFIFFIGFIVTFLLTIFFAFKVYHFYKTSEKYMLNKVTTTLDQCTKDIDNNLKNIEIITKTVSDELSSKIMSEEQIKEKLENLLKKNQTMFGLLVTFAPYEYKTNQRLFSIYCIRKDDSFEYKKIENSYDYTLSGHDWYSRPQNEGAVWCDPFWGASSNSMVVSYSIPVYKEHRFIAVATAVCSMDNLVQLINSFDLGGSGYGVIMNNKSVFLSHPNTDYVLNKISLIKASKNYSKENHKKVIECFKNQNHKKIIYCEKTLLTKQKSSCSNDFKK